MKKYSEMSTEELSFQLQQLLEQMRKNEQAGFLSEAQILEKKYFIVKSYMMDPDAILKGQDYQVVGKEELFRVRYINGIMAWGTFSSSSEEVAVLIGQLEPL